MIQRKETTCYRNRSAFTLVELMISIALVLFLLLGVNQVFTYTTQAVGAGEAINSAIRSSRAAEATFSGDFNDMVPNGSGSTDSACMIISSRAAYAYRDAKDLASQGSLNASAPTSALPTAAFQDFNNDGSYGDTNVPGEVTYPATYNGRNHRLDCVSFFARDTYARQTGNMGVFVDPMSSREAWIWYGHLWLPDNSAAYPFITYPTGTPVSPYPAGKTGPGTFPGAGNVAGNPNNIFSSQFVLGRVAELLIEKSADTAAGTIQDSAGNYQRFINRLNSYTSAPSYASELQPLCGSSAASTIIGDTASWISQDTRFDMAATSISAFQNKLASYLNVGNAAVAAGATIWFDQMMDGNPTPATSLPANVGARFKCNPFISKPMTSDGMAQASPYMLQGCSQFIVEFAGDFLVQDNDPTHTAEVLGTHSKYGDVNMPGADGQIDYVILASGQKQIAWYGMPRSTSGNTTICATNGDVVPLRDYFQNMHDAAGNAVAVPYSTIPNTVAAGYPTFEKIGPAYPTNSPVSYSGGSANGGMSLAAAQTGYTCAFGPTDSPSLHPKLIRITITLEDPTGRLPNGQTYQYVFTVPPNASGQ